MATKHPTLVQVWIDCRSARALDPPRGRRSLGCLLRPRRLRGGDQDGQRHHGGHRLGAFIRR